MTKQIKKWRESIEDITNDVTDLLENQFVFNRVAQMVKKNAGLQQDNLFWDYLKLNYGSSMILGISRQVDTKKETFGFLKLLEEMSKHTNVLTMDWFVRPYKKTLPDIGLEIGENDFRKYFGCRDYVDMNIIKGDIQKLKDITANIREFRHTRIAHRNKDATLSFSLSFSEINKALNVLQDLVIKYQILLNQVCFDKLLPVITYDWEAIFRKSWINENV